MESLVKREIIEFFNDKPKNGINKIKEWCANNNKDFSDETAKFFYEEKKNLNLEFVGDYLGTDLDDNKKVLEHFVKQFNFKEKDYLESLRKFLEAFKLPGEAQKIDRLVESFGSKYYEQNLNGEIKSKDAAYILAFQTIMLNTDLHNPSIAESKKMTFEQLKNNLRGTNANQNFSDDLLSKVYDGIKAKPFELNFTKIAAGYEIAGINSQDDKIFTKLDNFLTTKTDINSVFPDLENITAEHKQPKTWLNKFTGYEGSVVIKGNNAEVEIQVYKPNILSKWFLGEKNKLVIQPKQQSEQSLRLAAQIAASFETKVTSIKATYDYLKEDLETLYKNPKKELEKASSVVELHSNIRETTKKIQRDDPEILDTRGMPIASETNFEDLSNSDIGEIPKIPRIKIGNYPLNNVSISQNQTKTPTPKEKLTVVDELRKKIASRAGSIVDTSEQQEKNTEEKIDNHAKRLEELKQKQQGLETKRKELEEKKANSSREERWKITAELENINNHLRSIEKEYNTINTATEREKQFNNNKLAQNKEEPTAADLQQQGAMAAIKRMKAQKAAEAANKNVLSDNQVAASSLTPGVIPPPPPMPKSSPSIPTPPPMPTANKINIPSEVQENVKTITKQISQGKNKPQEELAKAVGKRNKNLHER